MTDRELMQQALDVLEDIFGKNKIDVGVINRLRDRLAQPEQEPVAWVYQEGLEALKSGRPWTAYGSSGGGRIPLYLNDAVAPKAEPRSGESGAGFESLPASPTTTWWDDPVPQMRREWQGLTDEDVKRCYFGSRADFMDYARAIEAKLRERNT